MFKKIELRLCIKWLVRHFLVEGVKVKVFVTASSFGFSFESQTVGSQYLFLQEMEVKGEKHWPIAMNMTRVEHLKFPFCNFFRLSFSFLALLKLIILRFKCSFLITYRKFIHVYNAQKQQESLKMLLHSLTHF